MQARILFPTHPRLRAAVIVLVSLLVVGYLYGANLRAKWSVFDDHEIMWFIGNREQLPFSEIVPKLLLTEVGPQSDLPRFRPAYYSLRLLETFAWGKRPGIWYAAHLLILAFFMSAVWALSSARIGFLASGFLAVYAIALPFWSGIFSALGPGETYATLGLALYLIGTDLVFRRHRSSLGWCLLLAGTLIAAGSKENMLWLALPLPFLLWHQFRQAGSKWLPAIAVVLGVLWCAWIALTLVSRLRAAGGDVYANPIGIRDGLMLILGIAPNSSILGLLAAGLTFCALWLLWRRRDARLARASLTCLILVAGFMGLYGSQVVFHSGSWPTGTRYDFPGMLIWPGLLLVVSWYIRQLSSLTRAATHRMLLAAAIPTLGLITVVSSIRNIPAARALAANNVAATSGWTALIAQISRVAVEHTEFLLMVQSNDPADFEPLISYPRFFSADGVQNQTYLLWTPHREGVSNYRGSISDQLVDISEAGLPGLYLPLAQMDAANSQCILVVISGKPRWPCQIVLDADWRLYYQ